jgi:transcriptional regulator with XRE-family HTH domain
VLADVAMLAGVSMATASRVINNSPNVSAATRMRVLDAVEELEYTVDRRARSLATGSTRTIGVLVQDLGAPEDLALVRAVMSHAASADLQVLIAESRGDATLARQAVARWQAGAADGIVILPNAVPLLGNGPTAAQLRVFSARGGSVVQLGTRRVRGVPGSMVHLDEYRTAADLGAFVAATGRRRFLVVASTAEELAGDRAQGFEEGVRRVHGDIATLAPMLDPACGSGGYPSEAAPGVGAECIFAVSVTSMGERSRNPGRGSSAGSMLLGVPLTTFAYSGQDLPLTIATAVMPAHEAAARAIELTTSPRKRTLHIVGSWVSIDAEPARIRRTP